jgi:SAM-dependent methyltransferase
VCENKIFKRILSLGFQPYANNFSKDKHQDKFPLEINLCEKCFNSQLSILPNFKKLFRKYLYKSSVSKEFSNHFSEAALNYIKKLKLKKKSFIIDVGSNDGVGLLPFKNLGYKNLLGIEPAKNLANITKKKNIKVISSFLNLKTIKKIKKKADLILASNVFAHADNLEEMLICMLKLLKKNGNIVIEVQYFAKMINDLSFDNIYHEHVNYWTLDSLINFTSKYNCKIYKAEEIDTHGGSLRIYINKKKNTKTDLSIHKILKNEQKLKLKDFRTYEKFQKKINNLKKIVNENLGNLKKIYGELIGYGAPAKASTSINYFNIDKNIIKFVVDDNPLKVNKFIPGTDIIIKSKNNIQNNHKCIIVFAWNMLQEIKKKYKNKNINFISIRELQKKL